jgi:hypothetical protein
MIVTEKTSALDDSAEGNSAKQQEWLQAPESSQPATSSQPNSSSASSKFRAAVRNVGAVAAVARSRDMWLQGGASSASATTRWYNLHLGTIDAKRALEADADALGCALAASDILPIPENSFRHHNPLGIEVLACTAAVACGSCVMAGYVDGTFRIWKHLSVFAPPLHCRQAVFAKLHGSSTPGAANQFYCVRTFKLSDAGIADIVMTRDDSCAVVCDVTGTQFSVSLCQLPQQTQSEDGAFQLFGRMQTPFWFTSEPDVQVLFFVVVATSALCSLITTQITQLCFIS